MPSAATLCARWRKFAKFTSVCTVAINCDLYELFDALQTNTTVTHINFEGLLTRIRTRCPDLLPSLSGAQINYNDLDSIMTLIDTQTTIKSLDFEGTF